MTKPYIRKITHKQDQVPDYQPVKFQDISLYEVSTQTACCPHLFLLSFL